MLKLSITPYGYSQDAIPLGWDNHKITAQHGML